MNQCLGVQWPPKSVSEWTLPQSSGPKRPDRSAGRSRLSAAYYLSILLLNAEVENRHPSTFVGETPVNYDDIFIDLRTDNDAENGNHLRSTTTDADYDQLLGQAEHGSIPLQSPILRHPWFLKEVTARLQRNEDEVSSDDESFV
jgi:hypothetical protein